MNVGLAEKLIATDPEAAAELLREARETAVSALEDLRSVVRGIHPPVLADRGPGRRRSRRCAPDPDAGHARRRPAGHAARTPVESAAYFAVAECLANTVKHADADSGLGRPPPTTATVLRLVVGDDGRGGADPRAPDWPAWPRGSRPSTAQ